MASKSSFHRVTHALRAARRRALRELRRGELSVGPAAAAAAPPPAAASAAMAAASPRRHGHRRRARRRRRRARHPCRRGGAVEAAAACALSHPVGARAYLMLGELESVFEIEGRDGEGAAGDLERRHRRVAAEREVAREEVHIHRRRHQHELERRFATEEVAQDHQKEVGLHRPLVHLIHKEMGDAIELRVLLQPAHQDARRAEEQRRRRRALALQPDGIPHRTARHLAALGGDAFGDAERRDRRGCVLMLHGSPRSAACSSTNCGACVDLPLPVSPSSTTACERSSAPRNSARCAATAAPPAHAEWVAIAGGGTVRRAAPRGSRAPPRLSSS